jgi:hypothetical protein
MKKNILTRRDFLKMAGVTSAGLALSACGVDATRLPDLTATPSLTPFPTSTNTPTITPTPKPPTMGELARKLGFDIGIALRIVDDFNNLDYQNFLLNFSMLTDAWASHTSRTDNKQSGWGSQKFTMDYWNMLSVFCKSHNMNLDLHLLYWGYWHFQKDSPVYYLNQASKEEVETWYHERIKMFFEIPYFTSAIFANEVIVTNPTNLDYWWVTDFNPLYNIYGKNYPYESYKVAWNEAIKTGREVGKDIHLIYNTTSSETKSPGGDFEYSYLAGLRDKLNKEFGIERPFDIGLQLHTGTAPIKDGECWRWNSKYYEKTSLTERFKKLGEIGDIRITEFSIADTQDIQEQKDILHTVVESFIESGFGKSFIMWGTQEQFDTDLARINLSCSMRNLMDASYTPMFMFDELYKILQSKL